LDREDRAVDFPIQAGMWNRADPGCLFPHFVKPSGRTGDQPGFEVE
jgi:hypothetical protein